MLAKVQDPDLNNSDFYFFLSEYFPSKAIRYFVTWNKEDVYKYIYSQWYIYSSHVFIVNT